MVGQHSWSRIDDCSPGTNDALRCSTEMISFTRRLGFLSFLVGFISYHVFFEVVLITFTFLNYPQNIILAMAKQLG